MASGAAWMVLAKLVERSLGLLSTLILARVLVPHDFGVVAMAMTFVALVEMLSTFGFETTLIQKQTKERSHWDTAWTFGIVIGVLVGVVLVAGAAPVAAFFKEPALREILPVLAIGSVAYGFQNIGIVAFRTEMRFDREFRFHVTKKLLAFGVTIPLAFILDSYWALVIGQTVARIGGTALSYWVHPYRPRLTIAAHRELFGFSKWLLVISFISYLKERSSDWVIGRFAGPAGLGGFNISYELASLASTEIVAPINRAVFPAYAKLALEGRDALRREYLSVIAMVMLIATPAVVGVAATAPLLVPVLLGPNWSQAIPVLMLLGFFGLTHLIQSNAQAAYLALGRADIPAKLNGFHVAVQLAALVPLTSAYGVVGSAWAYLVTATVMIPMSLGVLLRMLHIRLREFCIAVWRPVLASILMYLAVTAFTRSRLAHDLIPLWGLLVAIAIGVVTYVTTVSVLWLLSRRPPGAENFVLTKARGVLTRFLPGTFAAGSQPRP